MTHLGFDFNHQEAGERYVDSLWRSNGSMTFRSTMAFQDLWGFVGQGDTLAAPIDMAMIAGAIANEGTVAEPYLVERITDMDDDDVRYESGEAREVKLFSAKVAQQADEIWSEGYETYYWTTNPLISYMKTGTAECGDGVINRSLVGVIKEYNTAFFIYVEDVWSGADHCFAVADALSVELQKNLGW